MKKAVLMVIMAAAITFLYGCKKTPSAEITPQTFTASFASLVAGHDEKALAAYEGNTYRFNARAGAISSDKVLIYCSERAKIRIFLPQGELEKLQRNGIASFEGRVKEVKTETWNDKFSAEIVMEDARVIESIFEIKGRVEEIFWDCYHNEQYYAAIWDSSVFDDVQINIYLPDEHTLEPGDSFTARGALLYPSNPEEFVVAYLDRCGLSEVFVMPEPEFIRKEADQ